MFFNNPVTPNTTEVPFNWVADYFDGTHFAEYDLVTNKKNSFYSINQNNTIRFGLFGQGMKFFFENISGKFNLAGKSVDIAYRLDGETYLLTNSHTKRDLIAFKEAVIDRNPKVIEQKSNVSAIAFGYKTNLKIKDANIHFQPVVILPNGDIYIETKLSSDKDLDGEIVFFVRGKESQSFHAPLTANISSQINWTVKW